MINPVWLRTFCSLVEVTHFTRTAEHLNMTQSGVSQHIKKLEDHLKEPLLTRHGKQFTLTDAGERLYHEGRALIEALSNLEKRIGIDPPYEGGVSVVSPGSLGLKLYSQLLQLQKNHPALVIDYRFAPNADVERLIAEHKVDVGFMTKPPALAEVNYKPIAKEELLLVTEANKSELSWADLLQIGFVDHPDGSHHASLLLGANFPEFKHESQLRRTGFSNQINLILEPVSMGLGFTVLPRYAVEAFERKHQIQAHRLLNKVSETIYLASHTNKVLPRRVMTVITEAELCLK